MQTFYSLHAGLSRLCHDRNGLTNIEYGILLSLLAVSSVGVLDALGVSVKDGFASSGDAVAANREALFPTSGGDGSGGVSGGGDGEAGGGSGPDEPPVAGGEPVGPLPEETIDESTTPDEPPVAAMKMSSSE